MRLDPEPYLRYLDKEMNIMGILAGFSAALAWLPTERVADTTGFFGDVWRLGRVHMLMGAAAGLVACFLFYLQRSHLAWLYGGIALAQVSNDESDSVDAWLEVAKGWDTWRLYKTAFVAVLLAVVLYAFAAAEAAHPPLAAISKILSLWVPVFVTTIFCAARWYVLSAFSHEDQPFLALWSWLSEKRHLLLSATQRVLSPTKSRRLKS